MNEDRRSIREIHSYRVERRRDGYWCPVCGALPPETVREHGSEHVVVEYES